MKEKQIKKGSTDLFFLYRYCIFTLCKLHSLLCHFLRIIWLLGCVCVCVASKNKHFRRLVLDFLLKIYYSIGFVTNQHFIVPMELHRLHLGSAYFF